ncbi:MAG: tRNA 2-thiouridine(34) synthase MnmA [Patescibacteria group bacterium]
MKSDKKKITRNKKTREKKVVFVGLSGGVDSAVSASLLLQSGYEVVGVFIKTWHPDFLECNEEEERRDAMRVAAHLDIPFLTFDFEDVYKKEVADYMIREYRLGRTPNPDVMCNKEVKFGAFLQKALSMGADYVATGHYSQISEVGNDFLSGPRFSGSLSRPDHAKKYFQLCQSSDPSKDQSYFLWTLKQEQISKIIFPIGSFKKIEVRKLAKKFNLPVAEKHDSQGICFLGDIDLKEFLKHYIKEKRGKVLNDTGEEIGYHDGVVFHTLGERHGFTITKKSTNDGRYYVVSKDVKKNTLIVSQEKNMLLSHGSHFILNMDDRALVANAEERTYFNLGLENVNWISQIPEENKIYKAQIRYHGEFLPCKIKCLTPSVEQNTEIIFEKPVLVAPGQSIVLYDKDVCLGGGVVR